MSCIPSLYQNFLETPPTTSLTSIDWKRTANGIDEFTLSITSCSISPKYGPDQVSTGKGFNGCIP